MPPKKRALAKAPINRPAVKQAMRKERKVRSANAIKPEMCVSVDMTLPASHRPLAGIDIETWRARNQISMYDAQSALGLSGMNQYSKACGMPILPVALEILVRLYDEIPGPRGWERFTLLELFNAMYGPALAKFDGTPQHVYANVDLGTRFTRMFGRSKERRSAWLASADGGAAYSEVYCILAKLKQLKDAKASAAVMERVARGVWLLRGIDIDEEYPIPTPDRPPVRLKRGGRPASERLGGRLLKMTEAELARHVRRAAAKKAAKKAPPARKKRKSKAAAAA